MSTPHTAKIMALEAYAQQRLTASGSLRLERHLSTCAECRSALSAIRTYDGARIEAQQEAVPELAWERLERALEQTTHAPEGVSRPPTTQAPRISGKVIALAWPVLALAATFTLGFLALSGRRVQEVAQPSVVPPVVATAEEARSQGWITLVAGEAELELDGVRTSAQPGQPVREGARIHTGKDSEAHVALAGGGGLVVEAQSDLTVARLRVHSVELTLASGQVFQQVRKLAEQERYEVAFGPYVARVRGTRFRVGHVAAGAQGPEASSAEVHEGHVVVHQGEQLIADLRAGQSWSSSAGAQTANTKRDRDVHAAAEASEKWPTLTLPPVSSVAAWRIDGSAVTARAGLAMRLPPGDVTLSYEDARGRERTLALQVAPEGSALSEVAIRELIAAQNDPMGSLDPEQIGPVVRAGLDSMRRCYERGLKRDPGLVGKLVLSIRVAPDGHVARASLGAVGGPKLPLDVESCMQSEARGWQFPRPSGGSVVFEVPLNLKSAR